jgi:hypothetical protein
MMLILSLNQRLRASYNHVHRSPLLRVHFNEMN